ncbi:hypothetical protein AAY473_010589 [Plecturocebus cupreus]
MVDSLKACTVDLEKLHTKCQPVKAARMGAVPCKATRVELHKAMGTHLLHEYYPVSDISVKLTTMKMSLAIGFEVTTKSRIRMSCSESPESTESEKEILHFLVFSRPGGSRLFWPARRFCRARARRFPVQSIQDGPARLVPSPQGKQQLEALRSEFHSKHSKPRKVRLCGEGASAKGKLRNRKTSSPGRERSKMAT